MKYSDTQNLEELYQLATVSPAAMRRMTAGGFWLQGFDLLDRFLDASKATAKNDRFFLILQQEKSPPN
ncbi:hypothetical protein [Desulfuromonas versatilis]|uniref:hypothetical protein n=1 Tax=Desulfuromonas versatilis TaxID=2802975 RepID=UPI001C84D105|nr:hypothetical protein [Desulfuromonas versatilis]